MTESTTLKLVNDPNDPNDPKEWWPSKVCTEAYFRRVVSACYTAYVANSGKLPDVQMIARYMGAKPSLVKIQKVLVTSEFKAAVGERGISWSGKAVGITPEQQYAISIILDPSSRKPFDARLKSAGITYFKWQAWLKQPLFAQAVNAITESSLTDNIPAVHTALINRAVGGDVRAMEFFYKISGRFDPDKEAQTNLNAVVLALIEILTRRITDPVLLEVIGEDIESVLASQGGTNKAIPIYVEEVQNEPEITPTEARPITFELPNQSAFSFVKE